VLHGHKCLAQIRLNHIYCTGIARYCKHIFVIPPIPPNLRLVLFILYADFALRRAAVHEDGEPILARRLLFSVFCLRICEHYIPPGSQFGVSCEDFPAFCYGGFSIRSAGRERYCIIRQQAEILAVIDGVGATVLGRPCTERVHVRLTKMGQTVNAAILHNNHNDVITDKYAIMPNHIHMIIVIDSEAGDRGRSPLQRLYAI
jgi:hypothetical protein